MMKNWQETTLGEITDIIAGQSPESKYYNKEQKGLPFYQGKKEFTEKFIGPPFIWTTVITKEAFKNDILLSVRAPVGPINYATEKCCIGRGLAAIRVKNNITREFIFYYLLSIQKNISGHDGVVFPSINRDEICSLKLKIPIHLSEQKRIVKILDKAFEDIEKIKENAKQNLQNSKDLFDNYLNKIFTLNTESWQEATLNDITIIQPKKDEIKNNLNPNTFVSFVPMHYLGINSKYFISNEQKRLNDVVNNYTYFKNNDILLAKITPCFENGKLGIAKNLVNGVGFGSSEFIVFRPKEILNDEFLYYFLLQKDIRIKGLHNMHGAVGHKRVSIDFIKNYKIKFPNKISQQKQIVKKLDMLQEKTKKLEEIYNKKLQLAEELKQSILHKAFNGDL